MTGRRVLTLTEREEQALRLRAQGLLWKQVGYLMGCSGNAASTHAERGRVKLAGDTKPAERELDGSVRDT